MSVRPGTHPGTQGSKIPQVPGLLGMTARAAERLLALDLDRKRWMGTTQETAPRSEEFRMSHRSTMAPLDRTAAEVAAC